MATETMNEHPDDAAINPSLRTFVSLLLVVHLFFVFVALGANLTPSALQSRILRQFGFYAQTLNVDLGFTPFYLTHATAEDVDHTLELLPQGKDPARDEDWIVLGEAELRGGDGRQRYQRLARLVSTFSQQDELTARLAKTAGEHLLHQRDLQPQRFRCRKHMLQHWTAVRGGTVAQRDPYDPSYYRVVYDANLIVSARGEVNVVKLAERGELAQPTTAKDKKPDASNR